MLESLENKSHFAIVEDDIVDSSGTNSTFDVPRSGEWAALEHIGVVTVLIEPINNIRNPKRIIRTGIKTQIATVVSDQVR